MPIMPLSCVFDIPFCTGNADDDDDDGGGGSHPNQDDAAASAWRSESVAYDAGADVGVLSLSCGYFGKSGAGIVKEAGSSEGYRRGMEKV
jgi:hypothetical protein